MSSFSVASWEHRDSFCHLWLLKGTKRPLDLLKCHASVTYSEVNSGADTEDKGDKMDYKLWVRTRRTMKDLRKENDLWNVNYKWLWERVGFGKLEEIRGRRFLWKKKEQRQSQGWQQWPIWGKSWEMGRSGQHQVTSSWSEVQEWTLSEVWDRNRASKMVCSLCMMQ